MVSSSGTQKKDGFVVFADHYKCFRDAIWRAVDLSSQHRCDVTVRRADETIIIPRGTTHDQAYRDYLS